MRTFHGSNFLLSLAKMCRDADEMTSKRGNLRNVVYPVWIFPLHARLRADTLLILVFSAASGRHAIDRMVLDLRVHATHRGEFITLHSGVSYCRSRRAKIIRHLLSLHDTAYCNRNSSTVPPYVTGASFNRDTLAIQAIFKSHKRSHYRELRKLPLNLLEVTCLQAGQRVSCLPR